MSALIHETEDGRTEAALTPMAEAANRIVGDVCEALNLILQAEEDGTLPPRVAMDKLLAASSSIVDLLGALLEAGTPQQQGARATPGPYAAARGGDISFVLAGDGLTICATFGRVRDSDECWANAKLIAAALNNEPLLCHVLAALLDNPHDAQAQKRAAAVLATTEQEAGNV